MPVSNFLLSGPPRCGKTTAVRRLIDSLRDLRLAGFYTEEIREHGRRVGFRAVGLNGGEALLAHVSIASPFRVASYGVDPAALEPLLASELGRPPGDVDLYVIDEIGKMECFSRDFVASVRRLLASPALVLATVAFKGGGFPAEVRTHADAELFLLTPANRDELPGELASRIRRLRATRR